MSDQQSDLLPELKGQVIQCWTVVYNNDADCVYVFFDWKKVLAGVEGSLRTYMDEGIEAESLIRNLMVNLRDWSYRPLIPIHIHRKRYKFSIDIYRWEIDAFTSLYRILSRCYEQVDDATKLEIMTLLSNSKR